MNKVYVVDTEAVTGLGNSVGETWEKLVAGKTAFKPVTRFATDNYNSNLAAIIEDLKRSEGESLIHPLVEKITSRLPHVPAGTRIITATTKSGIDNLEKLVRGNTSDPSDVSLSCISEIISKKIGLDDNGINVSAACASATIAVAKGASLIASGKAESVLVFCIDIISEFVFSGFSAMNAMSEKSAMPFDKNRSGLTLGEGAASILMMTHEAAVKNSFPILGTVSGWGAANDATHITAPARDGCGLINAICKSFKLAGITQRDIAAVNAHGTGTVHNDMMELTAFKEVFSGRRVPVNSFKGSLGHTLGAAGGIELVMGLEILCEQLMPPTVGLSEPEEMAAGMVSSVPVEISGNYLLTTNSGFSGINAAIVLKRGEV